MVVKMMTYLDKIWLRKIIKCYLIQTTLITIWQKWGRAYTCFWPPVFQKGGGQAASGVNCHCILISHAAVSSSLGAGPSSPELSYFALLLGGTGVSPSCVQLNRESTSQYRFSQTPVFSYTFTPTSIISFCTFWRFQGLNPILSWFSSPLV